MGFQLSIIIPTFNEARTLALTLQALRQTLSAEHVEIIVADGGSQDNTLSIAQGFERRGLIDSVVASGLGRAQQMNAGAECATGRYVLFLHADTFLPKQLPDLIEHWISAGVDWGYFPLRLSGQSWLFRIIERGINWRSRLTGVSTGDQCQFIRRDLFQQVGGFPLLPLMEDVAISKALRKIVWPYWEKFPVVTSSRRWESKGIIKTVLIMWSLRLAYFFGVSPKRLATIYYPGFGKN